MDLVENYPKMSHLLKKLAFAEVYILVSHNQVNLQFIKIFANTHLMNIPRGNAIPEQ